MLKFGSCNTRSVQKKLNTCFWGRTVHPNNLEKNLWPLTLLGNLLCNRAMYIPSYSLQSLSKNGTVHFDTRLSAVFSRLPEMLWKMSRATFAVTNSPSGGVQKKWSALEMHIWKQNYSISLPTTVWNYSSWKCGTCETIFKYITSLFNLNILLSNIF